MAYKPDGTAISNPANASRSKWALLASAVNALPGWLPIAYGVELFPHEDGTCQKLPAILNTYSPALTDYQLNTTSHCSGNSDVKLPPLSASYLPTLLSTIVSASTTLLCYGTPTLNALSIAQQTLSAYNTPVKYVVFVTDGKQGCGESSDTVWAQIQSMRNVGIYTVVVGFDGSGALNTGTAKQHLSDWACGGGKPVPQYAHCCDATGHYNTSACGTGAGNSTFYFSSTSDGSDLNGVMQTLITNICQ